jgi:hypothetical protein
MRAFFVVLALALGVGCIVAAAWLGSQPPKKEQPAPVAKTEPIPEGVVGPEISPTGPHPKAVAPETEHDFGVGMSDSDGQHTFIIRNEGEAPLVLLAHDKDRTCSCTGAKLAGDKPVLPGEETEVVLSWHIGSNANLFNHSAKIRTNDPANKVITLSVKGDIEKRYQFDPAMPFWDLGVIETETEVTSSKMIYTRAADHFEIIGPKTLHPRFKLTWEPLGEDDLASLGGRSGYRLNLVADVAGFTGTLNESFDLQTEAHGDRAITTIPLRVRKSNSMEFMARNFDPKTNRLAIGEFTANEGKTVEISVYARLDGEVNVVSAKSTHGAVKVSWEEDEKFQSKAGKTRRYLLKIEVPPAPPVSRRGDEAETVELQFNRPDIGTMILLVEYLSV